MLDLLPYPLRDTIANEIALELSARFQTIDMHGQFVSWSAMRLALETAVRRLGLDPWLKPFFQVSTHAATSVSEASYDM